MPDTSGAPRPKIPRVATFYSLLELLGAALLVGGLVAEMAIAQAAFGSPDILSHETAGRFMARVFDGSLYVEATAVFLIVLGGQLARYYRRGTAKLALLLMPLLFAPVVAHVTLSNRMREIRLAHGGTLEHIAADDPDRREFMKLHGIFFGTAILLLGVGVAPLVCASLPSKEAA